MGVGATAVASTGRVVSTAPVAGFEHEYPPAPHTFEDVSSRAEFDEWLNWAISVWDIVSEKRARRLGADRKRHFNAVEYQRQLELPALSLAAAAAAKRAGDVAPLALLQEDDEDQHEADEHVNDGGQVVQHVPGLS
jgi:hypothetical protein